MVIERGSLYARHLADIPQRRRRIAGLGEGSRRELDQFWPAHRGSRTTALGLACRRLLCSSAIIVIRLLFHYRLNLGSSQSRSESPNRLNESTVRLIARPG